MADFSSRSRDDRQKVAPLSVEDLYSGLMNISSEAVLVVDALYRVIEVNAQAARVCGLHSTYELTGAGVGDLAAPEDRQRFLSDLQGVLDSGSALAGQYRFTRRDGGRFMAEVRAQALSGQSDAPCALLITAREADPPKHSHPYISGYADGEAEALAEIGRIISSSLNIDDVYERFASQVLKLLAFDRITITVVGASGDVFTVAYTTGVRADAQGKGQWRPLSGSLTEQMIMTRSSVLADLHDEGAVESSFPVFRSNYERGARTCLGVPLTSKGQVIGALIVESCLPYAYTARDLHMLERIGHQIAGAISNAQLYADRLETQSRLRESEQLYRSLVEMTPEAIFIRKDEEGWEFLYANEAAATVFGAASPEEMIGRPVLDYVDPYYRKDVADEFRCLRDEGLSYRRSQGKLFRHDGCIVEFEASTTPITYQGILTRHVLMRDITEQKRLEQHLIQSQKMEALGTLTGGIAHDFNNLLTAILGYSQLGMLTLSNEDRLYSKLQEIEKAAQRAAGLTRQLLTFSRRQVTAPRLINVNDLVMDMDNMLRRLIEDDIELVTLPNQDDGLLVRADATQMEQVLVNLVVNARDAMPEGGKILIETETVSPGNAGLYSLPIEAHKGGYVMLSVRDTGAGIPDDVKPHIFEPFFTTKERGKGAGLGLSTCYGIITHSGGYITVESRPDQGSVFRVFLPQVERPHMPMPRRDRQERLPRGNETVLLVEDEPSVRGVASFVLREQGYNVMEAENGVEALRVVNEGQDAGIHLLLTDVVMPLMGGKELAQRLRKQNPDIKVLYTTGYAEGSPGRADLIKHGADILPKPFTPTLLARKVRDVLDREDQQDVG